MLLAAAPASARVVDYTIDDAAMRAAATELKIAPFTPLPSRGGRTVALTVDPGADQPTLALGILCSAYKVENPVSRLMAGLVATWAKDGRITPAADQAQVRLHVTSARSYRRCVEMGEMNGRCITKTMIAGTVEADGQTSAIAGEAERDASIGGFCGSLAKGIGVVSREAGLALIADAEAKLVTPAVEPPAATAR